MDHPRDEIDWPIKTRRVNKQEIAHDSLIITKLQFACVLVCSLQFAVCAPLR